MIIPNHCYHCLKDIKPIDLYFLDPDNDLKTICCECVHLIYLATESDVCSCKTCTSHDINKKDE